MQFHFFFFKYWLRETLNLLTNADSRTNTSLEKLLEGEADQWEAWNWSCDRMANERPKKYCNRWRRQTDTQTDIAILWLNRPSGAYSVKIWTVCAPTSLHVPFFFYIINFTMTDAQTVVGYWDSSSLDIWHFFSCAGEAPLSWRGKDLFRCPEQLLKSSCPSVGWLVGWLCLWKSDL